MESQSVIIKSFIHLYKKHSYFIELLSIIPFLSPDKYKG